MKVHQIYTYSFLRNYSYLIEGSQGDFYSIDPFDIDQILPIIEEANGRLVAIINTHEHFDHTCGNQDLFRKTGCRVYCHPKVRATVPHASDVLSAGDQLQIDSDWSFEILETPGHTEAHLCLLLKEGERHHALFSGDTIFNAGVGNTRNGGDPRTLYHTVENQILPLDDEVILYPGHEYMVTNLKFSLDREPGNLAAKEMLSKCSCLKMEEDFFTTNFKTEREINSFFRLDSEELRKGVELDMNDSREEVFVKLRKLRDQW